MNCRSFLKATTTVGISSVLAGCGMGGFSAGGTSSGSTGNATNATKNRTAGLPAPVSDPNQYASRFKNVVDMVEAGADPTGKEDVSPVIQREIGSDTLLVFPQGTYKMNSQVRRVGLRNIGIIGRGAVLRHGTVKAIDGFDVTKGEFSGPAQHFKIGIPNNPHRGKFIFGGFIADWRRPNSGIQILNHHTNGTSIIENVRQQGIHALGCQGPFRINCHGPSSKAIVRGVDLRFGGKSYQFTINTREERSGGGTEKGRSWATSGITSHPDAKGHLRVQNSTCGGWPDNGFYVAGGPKQTVEVINCVAANSQASNIRISGTDCRIKLYCHYGF